MTAGNQQRTSEELSEAILDTATQLFSEHGVESVSMHQIAKKTGIGQGTLYRRYANKAELCMELLNGNFRELLDSMSRCVQASNGQPAAERLRTAVELLVHFLDKKLHWLGVIHAHAHTTPAASKEDFFQTEPYKRMHGMLVEILLSATEEELLHPIDVHYTAHAYIAALSPHTYRHLICERGYTQREVADNFYRSFIVPLFAVRDTEKGNNEA